MAKFQKPVKSDRPLVAYYRVSTKQQGASGLGLEAQKSAIETYAARIGSSLVGTFREVETGKRSDRPELQKALSCARRAGGILVVAKLDRLARNVAFTSALLESGVEFVACDMPQANRFMIQVMAAVAEYEAKLISERTKAALAAARARGVKLGSARPGHWEGREEARRKGAAKGRKLAVAARKLKAMRDDCYSDLLPTIRQMREEGATFQAVAERLNADGHSTSRGGQWSAPQVFRVLRQAAKRQ